MRADAKEKLIELADRPGVRERLEARERCRTDKLFLAAQLGYDFVPAVHAELFAQFIPYEPKTAWALQSDIKKRLILWPRGHYKTTAVVVDIIQAILNFPDIRILIMQGSKITTRNLLHQIKCHFNGTNSDSHFRELFPEFCADRLGTADSFTTPARKNKGLAQATVTVASPRSVKTGQHYDIGFFDDLVNDQNYRSERLLQKVREDFMMALPLLDPPHYAVLTGTRYAFGDLYEETIRKNVRGEWTVSLVTCWLPDQNYEPRFPQQSTATGKVIGFTKEGLLSLQADDPEMFSSQYLNQPAQRGGQRFSKQLLESALVAPADAPPLSGAVFVVDLASTDSVKSDDSVIVVGKQDLTGVQYVAAVAGGQWTPPALANHIIELALLHRPERILFEKTASCIYFVDYLRLIARTHGVVLPIDYIKVNTQADAKYTRIASLEGLLKAGKLKFFAGIQRWDKLVEQFGMFPGGRGKHDDYPDTIALMAQVFTGATLAQPRRTINPILAMIEQQEQSMSRTLVAGAEPVDESEGFFPF